MDYREVLVTWKAVRRTAAAAGVTLLVTSSAWASPTQAVPVEAAPNAAAAPLAPAAAPRASTPPRPISASAAAKARHDEAVRKLSAADPESVSAGIAGLREQADQPAQRALIARVQVGLPPAQVVAALDALVAMRAKRALPVITELAQHRRPLVRSHALAAIGALEQRGARAAQALLLSALEDPSAEVCAAAATALGRAGTSRAVPALFSAYDRGVSTALPAIAELAGRESVDALLARMPQGTVEPVEPVLDRLLEGGKLSTADQVALARKLTGLGTPSARRYLLKWLDRIKLQGQARVKSELFQSLKTLDAKPAAAAAVAGPPPALASKGGKR